MIINSTDLSIRLQKLQCCLAEKISNISKKVALGLKCQKEISDAEIIMYIIEALKCQIVNKKETLASMEVPFHAVYGPATINTIQFDGNNLITTPVPLTIGDVIQSVADLVTEINLNGFGYTAKQSGNILIIYAPSGDQTLYNGLQMTIGIGNWYNTSKNSMSGGINEVNYTEAELDTLNCLSLDQLDTIFEYTTKLCDVCYAPYGVNYHLPVDTTAGLFTAILLEDESGVITQEDESLILLN